jgi:CheY-like chemotaxis protein
MRGMADPALARKKAMDRQHLWLVVEDDDDDFFLFCRACARALDREPCIHRENDGVAAQAFLSGHPQRPALIVSDLKMPRMNGLELLAWIRDQDHLRRIPFVMLSSSNSEKDVTAAEGLGAADYQVKPSHLGEFVGLVKGLDELQPLGPVDDVLHPATPGPDGEQDAAAAPWVQ